MYSWCPDAGTKSCGTIRATTGARQPGSRGERAISRKAIAQGMPDDLAERVVPSPCFFCARGPRVRPSPGIPCSLSFQRDTRKHHSDAICAARMRAHGSGSLTSKIRNASVTFPRARAHLGQERCPAGASRSPSTAVITGLHFGHGGAANRHFHHDVREPSHFSGPHRKPPLRWWGSLWAHRNDEGSLGYGSDIAGRCPPLTRGMHAVSRSVGR